MRTWAARRLGAEFHDSGVIQRSHQWIEIFVISYITTLLSLFHCIIVVSGKLPPENISFTRTRIHGSRNRFTDAAAVPHLRRVTRQPTTNIRKYLSLRRPRTFRIPPLLLPITRVETRQILRQWPHFSRRGLHPLAISQLDEHLR